MQRHALYARCMSKFVSALCSAAVLVGATSAMNGCASTAAKSSAPVISNVSISAQTIAVGQTETLTGQFDFADPDGDLKDLGLTLSLNGQSTTVPRAALQGVGGQTTGKANYTILVAAPQAGTVDLKLVVYDAAGNASNELKQSVVAR
jgi:hypothetical protein